MTDDVLALLRSLPPDLADPADRLQRVKARVADRRRRLAVAMTVVAVVAVVVPLAVLRAGGPAPAATPLTCPQTYGGSPPWVPDLPRGVDGQSRLVPPEPPVRAMVCAFLGTTGDSVQDQRDGWKLSGSRELGGSLNLLAADLTHVARLTTDRACATVGGPNDNYLLGLTYNSGTLWVSATEHPSGCGPVSNGQFIALNAIAPAVAASYAAGTWTQPPPRDGPCTGQTMGRLGQEADMVPPGAVSVEICEGTRHLVLTTGFTGLVDALNRPPTQVSASGCTLVATPGAQFGLLFHYTEGPSVSVIVTVGCQPAIMNGSLGADDAATVIAQIEQLLATG
jgi:hypothetical protein